MMITLQKVRFLRRNIPAFECEPGCHECCGPVTASSEEVAMLPAKSDAELVFEVVVTEYLVGLAVEPIDMAQALPRSIPVSRVPGARVFVVDGAVLADILM
jgi:hypothetical protein